MRNKKKGFCLVELIITMIVISILAMASVVALSSKAKEARDTKRLADMGAVLTAMSLACSNNVSFEISSTSSAQPTICQLADNNNIQFSHLHDTLSDFICEDDTSGCGSDSTETCDYSFGDPSDIVLANGNYFQSPPTEIDPCNYIINFYLEDGGISYISQLGIYNAKTEAEDLVELDSPEGFVDLSGYNQVVYTDTNDGDDVLGTGTEGNPYNTFERAYADITSNTNQAIFLQSGEYLCSVDDEDLKDMDVIGGGKDTTLLLNHSLRFIEGVNDRMYSLKGVTFYKMIFKTVIPGNNLFYGENATFYNVAFDLTGGNSYTMNSPGSNFNNCIDLTSPPLFLKGNHNLVNCYGRFFPGNGTNYSDYTIVTSMIEHPNFDANYNILSEGWEHAGTGLNPDASQAHIGIYGGMYAWGVE